MYPFGLDKDWNPVFDGLTTIVAQENGQPLVAVDREGRLYSSGPQEEWDIVSDPLPGGCLDSRTLQVMGLFVARSVDSRRKYRVNGW